MLLLLEQIDNLTFCTSLYTHNPHVISFDFTKGDHNSACFCKVTCFSFTYYNIDVF